MPPLLVSLPKATCQWWAELEAKPRGTKDVKLPPLYSRLVCTRHSILHAGKQEASESRDTFQPGKGHSRRMSKKASEGCVLAERGCGLERVPGVRQGGYTRPHQARGSPPLEYLKVNTGCHG